jgi:hypothetical protein
MQVDPSQVVRTNPINKDKSNGKLDTQSLPPQAQVMQIMTASILTQAVYAAAELGIADHLAGGSKTAAQIATAVGAHPEAVFRLMRALVSAGVFSQVDDERFGLSPAAECLRSDSAQSLRDMVLMMGSKWRLRAWEEIVVSIRTGKASFDAVFGMGPFTYFQQNPDAAAVFHRAMVSYTSTVATAVAAAYDFSSSRTLVDVAGGHGYLIAALLNTNPSLRGILFDLPEVVAGAQPLLTSKGVADRCKIVGGNFFESVTPGGDVYIMKQIIHDWDDDKASRLLRNCRRAMPAASKLLLIETVVPAGQEPAHAKLLDLEVLIALGGKERTEEQYRMLLTRADFNLTGIIQTDAGIQIVESVAS